MVEIFKALGDETRLRMAMLFSQEKLCVCEIEEILEISQSNASRHLNRLKTVGIISSERKAQWVYYYISNDFLSKYNSLWQEVCKQLNEGIYAEDKKRLEEVKKSTDC
ncbi:metalloregulator ArsR/SmtB family transcription factor [Proteinivorax hydrogeniformans]|uniref:Metalloregulator ArsR/SmtB family transcription factor n=1 Tax=Proteinivorax hydrogeniformans TaxID=1826727 RepID=A0AAU8HSG4_9FIRM